MDTPGTNAIIRRHEQLTQEFVPRSDLVLFVTSADRPFTESERAFLERIREWGKKVIIVLNKIDLLAEAEVAQVIGYIRENALALLGFTPEIFPVSAKPALRAKLAGSQASGARCGPTAASRQSRPTSSGRWTKRAGCSSSSATRWAWGNGWPANTAAWPRSGWSCWPRDLSAIENIEGQLEAYRADMQHDFRYRMADVEKVLLVMSNRGMLYFDETLRLARVLRPVEHPAHPGRVRAQGGGRRPPADRARRSTA